MRWGKGEEEGMGEGVMAGRRRELESRDAMI